MMNLEVPFIFFLLLVSLSLLVEHVCGGKKRKRGRYREGVKVKKGVFVAGNGVLLWW